MSKDREIRNKWFRNLAAHLAVGLVVAGLTLTRATGYELENFDDWTIPLNSPGNHTNGGWGIHEGMLSSYVAAPSTPYCVLLLDYAISTNSWLRSDWFAGGVGQISFNAASLPATPSSANILTIEYSTNGTDWVSGVTLTNNADFTAWIPRSTALGVFAPAMLRFRKSGQIGSGTLYQGIDDVEVQPPPPLVLSNVRLSPPSPTSTTPIHGLVDVPGLHPAVSNVSMRLYYRFGGWGPYISRAMQPYSGSIWRTETAIPAGVTGLMEFYVMATAEVAGQTNSLTEPASAPGTPQSVTVTGTLPEADLRQLAPCTRRTPLVISEIMYHPAASTNGYNLEFVEVYNSDPVEIDISGYRLSGEIDYTFPEGTVLPARKRLVVAAAPQNIIDSYPLSNVFGPYIGALSNGGGTVRLRNRQDAPILEVDYEDEMPWPVAADGTGHSMVQTRPDFGENDPRAWGRSALAGGSPGHAFEQPSDPIEQIQINEFLAHTDLPQIDFIELHNYGTTAVDATGCILTDSSLTNQYVITNGMMAANGFLAFDQDELGFSLSMGGDDIFLFRSDGQRVLDAVRFEAQTNGLSTGRWPDGAGDFHVLAATTPGVANATTTRRTESVVINELMFHPISGDDDDEYIELYNQGAQNVDLSFWRFTAGVTFTFPPGTTIPAGGYLVVARNADQLRLKYPQLNSANLVGNYSGRLSDSGERVALSKPDDPNYPDQDFVLVDEVTFSDGWGRWSDGGGSSLELVDARADNRLGLNWEGSDETAKAPWTEVDHTEVFSDGDTTEIGIFFILANQAAEFLVDDITFGTAAGGPNLIANSTFDSSASSWTFRGNHWLSGWEASGGFGDNGGVLRVNAIGQGNVRSMATARRTQFDRAETTLTTVPTTGTDYRTQARLRWQGGWPFLRLSLGWYWHEALVALEVPDNLGTPGQPNSKVASNAAPAIFDIQHSPVFPSAGQTVSVTCRVDDPDGIASVTLEYRNTASSTYSSTPMLDNGVTPDLIDGDGIFTAQFSGYSSGTIAGFHVKAMDGGAPASTRYVPGQETTKDALVRFGEAAPHGTFIDYSVWVSPENEALWESWETRGNGEVPTTVSYNGWRTVYDASVRWRGNGRGFSDIKSASYSVTFPKEEPIIGHDEVKMDIPSRNGNNGSNMQEYMAYWVARQIGHPAAQVRLMRVHVNGSNLLRQDLEVPTRDFCSYWYDDDDPHIFEHRAERILQVFRKSSTGALNMAKYRHGLQKKRTTVADAWYDRFPLIGLILQEPDLAIRDARLKALINPRGFDVYPAVNQVVGNTDYYGVVNAHNGSAYASPKRRLRWHLVDMDPSFNSTPGLYPAQEIGDIVNRPRFMRAYRRVLKELAEGPLQASVSSPVMDAWYQVLVDEGHSPTAATAIKSHMAGRLTAIQADLATHTATFAITTSGGNNFTTGNRVITLAGSAPFEVAQFILNGEKLPVTYPTDSTWQTTFGVTQGVNSIILQGCDDDGNVITSDTITVTSTASTGTPDQDLVISEIMYNPAPGGAEYIEIYNRSATESYDLHEWRLNGVGHLFGWGSIIAPGEYRIVTDDLQLYTAAHTNAEVVIGEFPGTLDNGGETLSLWMPSSPSEPNAFSSIDGTNTNWWVTIDSVRYDDDPPWPSMADGGRASLQLIDVSRDNSRPGNWGIPQPTVPPEWRSAILNATTPATLPSSPAFHIYLDGPGSVNLDNVVLLNPNNGTLLLRNYTFESPLSGTWNLGQNHDTSYRDSSTPYTGNYSLKLVATAAGDPYSNPTGTVFQIPSSLSPDTSYRIMFNYLQSVDNRILTVGIPGTDLVKEQFIGYDSFSGPLYTPGEPNNNATTLPPFPELWINEVMPSNVTATVDNAGENDPWIELYNSGASTISLGGNFMLSNNPLNLDLWTFPAGWTIAPGERLLVWADAQPSQTTNYAALHSGFRLNAQTGTVTLAYNTGTQTLVLDSLDYTNVGADYSYGSFPEGDPGSRTIFHYPSPGTTNSISSQPILVTINEWMSANGSTLRDPADLQFEDWFELYNDGAAAANIGGYTLTDDLGDPDKFTIPNGTYVPAKGFLLVWADQEEEQNDTSPDLHVNFGLSKSAGDTIALFAPDGSTVDAVTFGPLLTDRAEGRWPNGSSLITDMAPPTPEASNRVLAVLAVEDLGGAMTMSWSAQAGTVYRVETHSNLQETTPWTPIGVTTAQTSLAVFTDPESPTPDRRFYRIVIE